MTPETVVDIAQQAIKVILFVSGPMLIAGMLVGLLISVFQAATQINEMTMTFVPKIITVFVVLIITLPWAIAQITGFTRAMFDRVAGM